MIIYGTATFTSTLPANSFSGNIARHGNFYGPGNDGNCYKPAAGTLIGSCS